MAVKIRFTPWVIVPFLGFLGFCGIIYYSYLQVRMAAEIFSNELDFQTETEPLPSSASGDKIQTIIVWINQDNRLFMNDAEVSWETYETDIHNLWKDQHHLELDIRIDDRADQSRGFEIEDFCDIYPVSCFYDFYGQTAYVKINENNAYILNGQPLSLEALVAQLKNQREEFGPEALVRLKVHYKSDFKLHYGIKHYCQENDLDIRIDYYGGVQ